MGGPRGGGLGLAEVDVPPGAAVGEKIAALFPGVTDAFLSMGSQMMKAAALREGGRKASAKRMETSRHRKAG